MASPAPSGAEASPGMTAGVATGKALAVLSGRIVGAKASRVTAVPEATDDPGALIAPGSDGTFELALPPGRYVLELTVDGDVLPVTPGFEVKAEGPTRVVVTVAGDPPKATVAVE
jgi:hypothetical protein